MKKFLVAGIAAAALCGAPAIAADLPVKAPAYKAALYNWTGWYGGVFAGYGWGDVRATELPAPGLEFVGAGDTWGGHNNGFVGGGTLGYNYQVSNWVWGVEGDFGYLGITGDVHRAITGVTQIDIETNGGWFGTARGRLGFAADRTLYFVTGGAAFADLNSRIRTTAGVLLSTSTVGTTVGWTIGGGIEHAFDNRWSAKLEYLFMDFGTDKVHDANAAGAGIFESWNIRTKDQIVRVGLNYKFGDVGKGPVYAKY